MTALHSSKTSVQSCSTCAASPICLPFGLEKDELALLEEVVERQISIPPGGFLFHQHNKFNNYYAVQRGSFKKFTLTEDGREQINGFYLPGEFIGLDAVDTGQYDCSSVAIESSVVCEIPFEKLLSIASEVPNLQLQIIKLMSQRLRHADSIALNSQAIERLAAFLLNITTRYQRHNPDSDGVHLAMSRQEIGNFLGLAVETVSRLFTQLKREGVITTSAKEIRIVDFRKIQTLTCCHS